MPIGSEYLRQSIFPDQILWRPQRVQDLPGYGAVFAKAEIYLLRVSGGKCKMVKISSLGG